MRHTAIGILVLGVGLAGHSWALEAVNGSGHADVDAHIDFNKTVNVDETLYVEKAIFIKAQPKIATPGGGEAAAVANVGNAYGFYANGQEVNVLNNLNVNGNGSVYYGPAVKVDALIDDALNNNNGVMQINQDVGTMSNQGNLLAISDTTGPTGFGDSQAEVSQHNTGNTIYRTPGVMVLNGDGDPVVGEFAVERKSTMTNTALNNLGILNVNQNSGEMNNQTNANAVGVGALGIVIVGESALGQATSDNRVETVRSYSASTIQDSVNNNISQVSVNQASGGLNSQSSTFNFSALLSFSNPGISQVKF
ncbi:MAG: hypothetical protein AB7P12_15470 [Alphaproteobacteria bacterium]